MMRFCLLIVFLLNFPSTVRTSCCTLPFTAGQCQVNRQGPHRYQIMPDLQTGVVRESTECVINDFDAHYRKVIETKNYCNDCPGLLILKTNSSDIFLFPEYLERILEGRPTIQRKNVIILTTDLTGAYDVDFRFLSRFYSTHPVEQVPSIYVDLQLPRFDAQKRVQPKLLLRVPVYAEDREGIGKVDRKQLVDESAVEAHQLPFLYHFDITKHRYAPSLCNLYQVNMTDSALVWTRLDSSDATCHHYKHLFGKNPCFATGFTNLFCPIDINVESDDRLELSVQLSANPHVDHLTLAATGGEYVTMSLSNRQTHPAARVKILVLQGHLVVTDVNRDLQIRVEYGSNCDEFSLVVPDVLTATRYRRFNGEAFVFVDGNRFVDLPRCFKLIPTLGGNSQLLSANMLSLIDQESDSIATVVNVEEHVDVKDDESEVEETTEKEKIGFIKQMIENNNFLFIIIGIVIVLILLPLCLCLFYHVYCNSHRQSSWILDHSHDEKKSESKTTADNPVYIDNEAQTQDTPMRI